MDREATIQLLDDMNARAASRDMLLVAPDVMVALLNAGLIIASSDDEDRHVRYRGKTRIRAIAAMQTGGVALDTGGRIIAPTEANDSWLKQEFLNKSGPADPLRTGNGLPPSTAGGFRLTYPLVADIEAARELYPPAAGDMAASQKRQRHVDI
jgi:hypothetical protein